jgi:hypothetical protein
LDALIERLVQKDDRALFVVGVVLGRLGLSVKSLAPLVWRGWRGKKLWDVFDGECHQDIDRFMKRIL